MPNASLPTNELASTDESRNTLPPLLSVATSIWDHLYPVD